MRTEFDLGFRECEETKVKALYVAIENAIYDLEMKIEIKRIILNLKAALKKADK